MIRSNGQFIPDLATATASLRDLTKESSNFQWSDQHEREFQNVKQAFHKDILLQHFDTTKPTFIFVDAHQTGLSAILTQGASISATKAVAVASHTTTDTEKNTQNSISKPQLLILDCVNFVTWLAVHQSKWSLTISPLSHFGSPDENCHHELSAYY